MKKATGLGRGLSALLDEAVRAPRGEEVVERAGRARGRGRRGSGPTHQPRRHFDEEALDELPQSIADKGVLQPILLRSTAAAIEIIAGERRWRAAQRAQLHQSRQSCANSTMQRPPRSR